LQETKSYRVVPSTCKHDTPAYEYTMVHANRLTAIVQVKSGAVNLDASLLMPSGKQEVFLFTAQGRYENTPQKHVHCLKRQELEGFMREKQSLLPGRIRTWIELWETL
jgi:hypothetical protein